MYRLSNLFSRHERLYREESTVAAAYLCGTTGKIETSQRRGEKGAAVKALLFVNVVYFDPTVPITTLRVHIEHFEFRPASELSLLLVDCVSNTSLQPNRGNCRWMPFSTTLQRDNCEVQTHDHCCHEERCNPPDQVDD